MIQKGHSYLVDPTKGYAKIAKQEVAVTSAAAVAVGASPAISQERQDSAKSVAGVAVPGFTVPIVAAPVATTVSSAAKEVVPATVTVAAKPELPKETKDASENKLMVEYSKNLGDGKKIVNSNESQTESNILNIESSTLDSPLDEDVAKD